MTEHLLWSIVDEIQASISVKEKLKGQANVILEVAIEAARVLERGGKILLFGNGGSAADAQHIAGELVGRFRRVRKGLSAIALTTDSSILTALGNDFAFEDIFSRQIEALASKGDMAIGISTSGRSENIVKAMITAGRIGLKTVALTGGRGGKLARYAEHAIIVPSSDTQRIQESHITVGHILCRIIEDQLFGIHRAEARK